MQNITTRRERRLQAINLISAIAHIILIVSCVAAFRQMHPAKSGVCNSLRVACWLQRIFAVIVALLRPR
jgi:hypothetical protein